MSKRCHILQQQSPLPSGYIQLEYIESTGTQRILIPNYYPNTSQVARFRVYYTNNTTSVLFQTGASNQRFMFVRTNIVGRYDYVAGNGYKTNTSVSASGYQQGVWHEIEFTYNRMTIDGIDYNLDGAANIQTNRYGFNIFAQNWGDYGYTSGIRLNQFSIDNDFNLIAALRITDNKPGLYDTINGVFYTNQGTGEFLYA